MKEIASTLEDDTIIMDVGSRGGRGRKNLLKVPSIRYLLYDRFKQSVKEYTCIQNL